MWSEQWFTKWPQSSQRDGNSPRCIKFFRLWNTSGNKKGHNRVWDRLPLENRVQKTLYKEDLLTLNLFGQGVKITTPSFFKVPTPPFRSDPSLGPRKRERPFLEWEGLEFKEHESPYTTLNLLLVKNSSLMGLQKSFIYNLHLIYLWSTNREQKS